MNRATLTLYRRKLLAFRDRLAEDVSCLAAEILQAEEGAGSDLSHWPTHLADLATDAAERQCTRSLLKSEMQTLAEVAGGLGRIEQRTFGRCEGCRKDIPPARLHALPYARCCVGCAQNFP
jgi:RNA polymerase-binding transcription factor DksA